MTDLSRSPQRHTFLQKKRDGHLDDDFFDTIRAQDLLKEADPEWQKDNLEYDLRSTDWILEKVRSSESYAQNLYAALCNNDFQRADVWPILTDKFWSCSWRYAGGIIANMRQQGDYIDWYCSGIRSDLSDDDYKDLNAEGRARYQFMKNNFVGESVVTEEIEADLKRLGWNVIQDKSAK